MKSSDPSIVKAGAFALGLISLFVAVFALATVSGGSTPASAQVPPTATATRPAEVGLKPGSQCVSRINNLAVGQSVLCEMRVINYGPVTADDVTFKFSNVNLTVSNFAWRYGPAGALTAVPGTWNSLSNFGVTVDIPANSQIYATFTVTRTDASQYGSSNQRLCADATNFPEVCSQGGVN